MEFEELYPNRDLPKFSWLQVTGDSAADFSLSAEFRLIVSEKALRLLRCFIIENALIEPANEP
ncbi:hypothetical protein NQZ70_09865 [Sorangium sp. Soce836]|nr:hypothetical protein NQZ70_09865 [Sorangium sp. Soce836]